MISALKSKEKLPEIFDIPKITVSIIDNAVAIISPITTGLIPLKKA